MQQALQVACRAAAPPDFAPQAEQGRARHLQAELDTKHVDILGFIEVQLPRMSRAQSDKQRQLHGHLEDQTTSQAAGRRA